MGRVLYGGGGRGGLKEDKEGERIMNEAMSPF
jgi:hypothetical protein